MDRFLDPLGLGNALVLKDEVGAADHGSQAIDACGDAMGDHIFDLGVQLVDVREAAPLGLGHDGARHAVGEVLLDAGGVAQKGVLPHPREAQHALDLW